MAEKVEIVITASDQGASSTIGSVAGKVDELGTTAAGTGTPMGTLRSGLGDVAKVAGGFVVAQGLTQLPGILLGSARGAAEDSAAMAGLQQAVTNTGASYDTYGGAIDQAIKRGQDLAYTDGETATALDTLISLTGSTEEGMRRLSLAQDLARGTGMSLDTAARLLGKTSDENTSALSRYGIQVGENATAQDILNAVDGKFQGRAATFAESDAGKLAKAEQQMGELAESAGSFLLPAMVALAGVMTSVAGGIASALNFAQPFTSLIGDNLMPILLAVTPLLAGAGVVIVGAVVPAFIAWATATWAQVAAALAMNAAMLPIIAVLVGIGLAVAALYLAWDSNFLGIRDITMQVIDFVRPYIETAIGAILVAVETTLGAIQTVWDTVWPYLQRAIEIVWLAISTYVTTYIGIVQTVIGTALGIIQGAWDLIWPAIRATAETVWSGIRTAVEVGLEIVGWVETGLGAIRSAVDTVLVPVQGVFQNVFDTIKSIVDTTFNAAGGVLRIFEGGVASISTIISTAKDGILSVWGSITGGIQGAVEGIVEPIRSAVNSIIGFINGGISAWNSLEFPGIDMPGPIPDIPGIGTPNIPLIPLLASGARNFAGGWAVVGEQGPELVRLPGGSDVFSNRESQAMAGIDYDRLERMLVRAFELGARKSFGGVIG